MITLGVTELGDVLAFAANKVRSNMRAAERAGERAIMQRALAVFPWCAHASLPVVLCSLPSPPRVGTTRAQNLP